MPGIVSLVTLISLDVTEQLVASGYVAPPVLNIVDATNASPIVVKTSDPHGVTVGRSIHVVIAGVSGNAAANGTWIATAVDDYRLSLSTMSPDGTIQPSSGSGTYTSGGTMSKALTDGRIQIGKFQMHTMSAPPRIVFVPTGSSFGPRSVSNRSNVSTNMTIEQKLQTQARSLGTEYVKFNVYVWGQGNPDDYETDFDVVQVLYQQVIRSAYLMSTGNVTFGEGTFLEMESDTSQLAKDGRAYTFDLTIGTPIIDKVLPLVQPGTVASSGVYLNVVDPSHLAASGI